jgi:hypothetical protein
VQKTNRLLTAALFGSIVFVTNLFVPAPIDRLLIVVNAVLLALGALFINKIGATSVGVVGGLLTTLWRSAFPVFSFIITFLYGITVDAFFLLCRVNPTREGVNRNRLMLAMALSTLTIAFLSYYTSSLIPIIQRNEMLDILVLFLGPASGAVAGYAASYLWNKYLRNLYP